MSEPTRSENAITRYQGLIEKMANDAAKAMPLSIPEAEMRRAFDRLFLALRAAARANPDIYECTPESVGMAVTLSALTGLFPGGAYPDVDVIPRRIKGVMRLQWQISARGARKLAERGGFYVQAVPVFQDETFEVYRGSDERLVHVPKMQGIPRDWDHLVAVYVTRRHRTESTVSGFEVISKAEVEQRRAKSDSWAKYKSGPWVDWPVEMALKTAIKYAISRGLVTLDEAAAEAFRIEGESDAIVDEVPSNGARGSNTPSYGQPSTDPLPDPLETIAEAIGATSGAAPDSAREREPTGKRRAAPTPTPTRTEAPASPPAREIDPDTGEEIPEWVGQRAPGEEG